MGKRGPQPKAAKWLRNYTDLTVDYDALDSTWWAYVAGLIDGEGTIRANLYRKQVGGVQVEISNTYLPVLEEVGQKLGGIVRESRRGGDLHTCYEFGMWRASRVLRLLEEIYPYLRIKRWKAALAIMFLRRSGLNCRGDYDRQLLSWLKQIGGYRSF